MGTIDPVCEKELKPSDVAAVEPYGLLLFHFCSEECHVRFVSDPTKYVSHDPAADAQGGTTEDTHRAPQPWREKDDLEGPPTHSIGDGPART